MELKNKVIHGFFFKIKRNDLDWKNPSLFDCIRFIICIEVVVHDINCSNNNVEIYRI